MTVRAKSSGMIQAQSLMFSAAGQNLMILLASDAIKHGQDQSSYIASCRNLERKHSEPINAVLPSAGKSPRRVNEPANVHGECSVDRVHDGQFGKRLHHQVAKDNRQIVSTTEMIFVNTHIITPIVKPLDLSIIVGLSRTHQ
jgi:hypothetical protein